MKYIEIDLSRILAVAVIGILGGIFLFLNRDPYNYKLLDDVSFMTSGTMLPVSNEYRLQKIEGKWVARYERKKWDVLEESVEFEADPASVRKIIKYLKLNKVGKWDGFNKSNPWMNITDGVEYYFHASFSDGKTIDARGYEWQPRRYFKVRDKFVQLFEPYLEDS